MFDHVGLNVEDFAAGIIRFEGGITISVEASWALHTRKDRIWSEIFGEEGGALGVAVHHYL